MHVAVLCGGKGTRLGAPVKCLVEVAGRPWMDWKLEQLAQHGATRVTLFVGPHLNAFYRRYGPTVEYRTDPQHGIRAALGTWHGWWTMGDVLLDQPFVGTNVMFVRPGTQIAGLYLDCGLYHGMGPWVMQPTDAVPLDCNTPSALGEADAYLRRHGLARRDPQVG